jgi:hypothetical protein
MNRTLQFQREKSPSIGPKAAITAWYIVCAAAAAALTLAGPAAAGRPGDPGRQAALLLCAALYIARVAHTLFVYVKRAIPWWEAAWGGSLIGCVLFFFLLGGLRHAQPLGWIDAAALRHAPATQRRAAYNAPRRQGNPGRVHARVCSTGEKWPAPVRGVVLIEDRGHQESRDL